MQAALSSGRQGHVLLLLGEGSIWRTPHKKDGPTVLKDSFPEKVRVELDSERVRF